MDGRVMNGQVMDECCATCNDNLFDIQVKRKFITVTCLKCGRLDNILRVSDEATRLMLSANATDNDEKAKAKKLGKKSYKVISRQLDTALDYFDMLAKLPGDPASLETIIPTINAYVAGAKIVAPALKVYEMAQRQVSEVKTVSQAVREELKLHLAHLDESDIGVTDLPKRLLEFTRLLKIKNRRYPDPVPFVANRQQLAVLEIFDNPNLTRIFIPKARQMGISTIARAALCHTLMSKPNARVAIVSMNQKNSESASADIVRWMEESEFSRIAGLVPFVAGENNKTSRRTTIGSQLDIYTAGATAAMRGNVYDLVLITEAAYCPQLNELYASIDASTTRVIMESTPTGPQNPFSQFCITHASIPTSAVLFLPWYLEKVYSEPVDFTFILTDDEKARRAVAEELAQQFENLEGFTITDEQFNWYRKKLINYDGSTLRMKREYPETLDDCYYAATGAYIPHEVMNGIESIQTRINFDSISPDYQTIHPYRQGSRYVISCDPAHGTGNDRTAIVCVDATNNNVAAIGGSSRWTVDTTVDVIIKMAAAYPTAKIIVEANIGKAILDHAKMNPLKAQGRLWKDRKNKDWHTTATSRPVVCAALTSALVRMNEVANGTFEYVACYSALPSVLHEEICGLKQTERGFDHDSGKHDDFAFAFALGLYAAANVPPPISVGVATVKAHGR